MRGRWWALTLLSAVFLMHGVQCLVGDQTGGHTMTGSVTVGHDPTPEGAASSAGTGPAGAETPTVSAFQVTPAAPDPGVMALMMVCVAFLLGATGLLRRARGLTWSEHLPPHAMQLQRQFIEILAALRPPTPQTLCISRT